MRSIYSAKPSTSIVIIETETDQALNEIKLNYARRLLPVFARLYMNCMIQSISKSSLNLLRKLVNYSNKQQLTQILVSSDAQENSTDLSSASSTSNLIVEVIAKILQDQEDIDLTDLESSQDTESSDTSAATTSQTYESMFIALSISNDLFSKCSPYIVEEFTRFGVSTLITQLAQVKIAEEINQTQEASASIDLFQLNNIYVWRSHWSIMYTGEFIYLWQPHCLIELAIDSNGWFKFLLNNKLYSMYSNGSPDLCSDLDEESSEESNRELFVSRFKKARELANKSAVNLTLTKEIKLDNWIFRGVGETELEIRNACCSDQRTTLRKSLTGIEFESSKNEVMQFVGKINHGSEFDLPVCGESSLARPLFYSMPPPPVSTSASNTSSSSVVNKLSALQQYLAMTTAKTNKLKLKQLKASIVKLAKKLNDEYLKKQIGENSGLIRPRELALKLINLVQQMKQVTPKTYCLKII